MADQPPAHLEIDDTDAALAVVEQALERARNLGVTQAEAAVSMGAGLSATVRMGEVDTVEHHRDKALGITVYRDRCKGSANTSDFTREAIERTVEAASDIARATGADEHAGLADPELLAREIPDLDLYHPWVLEPEAAIELARICEDAARAVDARIENSDGASASRHAATHAYGNTHGFAGAWRGTSHSVSCAVIARENGAMQRDFWYTVARSAPELEGAEDVGRRAGERAISRLGARQVGTATVPVVFEARVAGSLFGHLVSAVSGASLYRKASFLLDAAGEQVFARGIDVREQPHIPRGIGSVPFDNDGVATGERALVEGGVLQGYVLDAYSARRLGLTSTGNAGGVHNLTVQHHGRSLDDLLHEAGRGLLVTELMGFGVNAVTGDYSRGASGFWFEDGAIRHPVEEVTVAGNLREMFRRMVAVADDVDLRGNLRSGSVLIDGMTVAGS